MFMRIYSFMDKAWQKIEIILTVFILTAMTLVTFAYTIINNLYSFFYYLAEKIPFGHSLFMFIGDKLLDATYFLGWTNAFTKACFAWLIFFCMSYGVRVGGHIGIDALVTLFKTPTQKILGLIGLAACLGYAGIMLVSSINWVWTFYMLGTEAEDLEQLHILKWHISIMVPIGFCLVIIRYLEIGYRIFTNQQLGLGLANEVNDALELQEKN
ncbi:C4-dicarboxylate TRAP transporter small permease protein DctQ [Gammaproteobacteria bacterium]|nr:C4-dicarboxylate TRAP transporter small permease protein DctQ [Gammaproteobacteria bacterium]